MFEYIRSLGRALIESNGMERPERVPTPIANQPPAEQLPDFSEVHGQQLVKRAIEVAAAGGHNLIMVGPPGVGKSMLSSRIPTILPALTKREREETQQIYRMAGIPFNGTTPFQAPHHTASYASIVGGGSSIPRPGAITLAHNGVLFMDELPEFSRNTLESLRQPLESDKITISRSGGSNTYPARFMLIAAMNPCPCGNAPNCTCKPEAIRKYRARISGPLLDRIDLHVSVPGITYETLKLPPGEASGYIRFRVLRARNIQLTRQGRLNARLAPGQAEALCLMDSEAEAVLRQGLSRMKFSARAYERVLRMARTVADLECSERVIGRHITEALHYRMLDK